MEFVDELGRITDKILRYGQLAIVPREWFDQRTPEVGGAERTGVAMIEVSDVRRGLALWCSGEYQGELLGEEEFLTHRRGGFDLFEIPRFIGVTARRQVDSGAFGLDFYAEDVRARIDAGDTHFLEAPGIDSGDEQLFSGAP